MSFLYPTQGLYVAAIDDLDPAMLTALHDPEGAAAYEPLWTACEELGLAVGAHRQVAGDGERMPPVAKGATPPSDSPGRHPPPVTRSGDG